MDEEAVLIQNLLAPINIQVHNPRVEDRQQPIMVKLSLSEHSSQIESTQMIDEDLEHESSSNLSQVIKYSLQSREI